MTGNDYIITYETPAVEVLLFEPEGIICGSPVSGGADNEDYENGGNINIPGL